MSNPDDKDPKVETADKDDEKQEAPEALEDLDLDPKKADPNFSGSTYFGEVTYADDKEER